MSLKTKATGLELAYALVAQNNLRVTDEIDSGTKFHRSRLETTTRQDYATYSVTRSTITTADGTDAATTKTLCNAIKAYANLHLVDADAHVTADTVIATANGTDAATTQTLANAIKTKLNTHFTAGSVHYHNDGTNTVSTANGTDAATTLTLVNAIKADLNAHVASAPNGSYIDVLPV